MDIQEILKLLPKFKEVNMAKIYTVAEMESSYIDYVKNIEQCKVSLGIPSFDSALGMIRPSQLITIIAGTNVGKTALALNIILANANLLQDKLIILIECEIDQNEIYERIVQMECNAGTNEVEKAYRDMLTLPEKFSKLKFKYSNVVSIIHRISADDIIPYCLACKELSGKEIGLIAVDYLGLINDKKYHDEYSRVTTVMRKLKEAALFLNVPFLNLSQPSRQDLKNGTGLTLYSGKSSGEIENSSQIVITLQRLDKAEDEQKHFDDETLNAAKKGKIFILKAKIEKKKQGKYSSCYLIFDVKTTVIKEYRK